MSDPKYDRRGIKKIQKNQELNAQAFKGLLITQLDKSCFQVIWNCKTSEYKKGSARLAWEAFCAMKQPKINQMVVMLKSQFHTCKMKRNTDPNQWITSLESIRAHIIEQRNNNPELEFKEHIAANLGLDYAQEAKQWLQIGLHRILIQHICSDLQVQYDMLSMYRNLFVKQNEKSDHNDNKQEETALAAGGGNFQKFKGCCHNCGKYGHKAYHCKTDGENKDNKNNNNNNKNSQDKKHHFQGCCRFCNIYGHKEKDCHNKIRAQNKETANPAAEGTSEGVSLIWRACDDAQDIAFLKTKSENLEDLAIADSGVTIHMFKSE